MGRVRDASKERYWRKLVRRQGETRESVSRFCARQGIPVHRFYWWRRQLGERPRTGHGGNEGQGTDDDAGKSRQDRPAFVPVRLPFSVSLPIEVVHPGGCVIRVPLGWDALSLRRILEAVDPLTTHAQGK